MLPSAQKLEEWSPGLKESISYFSKDFLCIYIATLFAILS